MFRIFFFGISSKKCHVNWRADKIGYNDGKEYMWLIPNSLLRIQILGLKLCYYYYYYFSLKQLSCYHILKFCDLFSIKECILQSSNISSRYLMYMFQNMKPGDSSGLLFTTPQSFHWYYHKLSLLEFLGLNDRQWLLVSPFRWLSARFFLTSIVDSDFSRYLRTMLQR